MRYVGVKNNKICVVSNEPIQNKELQVIEVPKELENLSSENLFSCRIYNGKISSKLERKLAKELKIAFVANYGSKCGIGTYSKFLFEEMVENIADYKIFSEITDQYVVENPKIPTDKIIPCWKRGESLTKLIEEIKLYNPDIILIQHEFGLWSNARYWISMMTQLSSYRVIVTMHSVFRHMDKTIVEACMPEIIVHLEGARKVLIEDKGITSKIHIVPHGCFPCIDETKLWNFYKSEHTFMQFGFLFRYKSFETSIKATAILKQKYPDIFFTALCSENPHSMIEHELYYNDLLSLIEGLDLKENVGIIRGFQSETVLNSYLRINRAAVFPYVSNPDHECFGSSGASPYAMTKGIPVITSNGHHFRSLPSLKGDTAEEIAENLKLLFNDNELCAEQIKSQNKYLLENSWKVTAQRYLNIFENS